MSPLFEIHPRLKADCIHLGRFELCQLLMMNDSQYPWFILVPEMADITEIHQLSAENRHLVADESNYLAENIARLFKADKLNIAAIGNLVAQLHVHHVVRYQTDRAWPAPVWGKFTAVPYSDEQLAEQLELVKELL